MHSQNTLKYVKDGLTLTINQVQHNKVKVNAIDKNGYSIYEEDHINLRNINFKTIEIALAENNQDITLEIQKKTLENIDFVMLIITVKSSMLANIVEKIFVKKVREISTEDIIKEELFEIPQKIEEVRNKLNKVHRKGFYVAQKDQPVKSQTNDVSVVKLSLPPGKYLMTASFLVHSSNSWFYGGFVSDRNKMFDQQGFYLQSNGYCPITAKCILDVNSVQTNVQFVLYPHHSWPSTIRNFIMTAQLIS